ncbi:MULTISPECIES: recombinase family protein [Frankia]|uniref:Integrase/recombinase n=1 Tax=Frankia alni (strain DSM 45986 / CECT 9034 / ACN14a) TaxID=326424 RepID=Q0RTY7_FRAAA|nr:MULTISPECIES: recombinase family protein [Frankia]CAJ58959.1 putative integrase/recombinase [Frankia alni ACN14a]
MTVTDPFVTVVGVPGPVRPVGYVRISLDREGAGLGVARQTADLNDVADRLGLPRPEVVTDNDVSAYSKKRRPGYEEVLAGIASGRWNVLLVWHVDRLTRSPKELEEIVDLANRTGLRIETVKGGRVDLSTGEGRLHARILGGLARYESEHRSDRVRRKMLQNAEAGLPHGGMRRPFGYEPDGMTVRPAEAEVIRWAVGGVIAGRPLRALVAELNDAGVATSQGARWSSSTLRGILVHGRVAGFRVHQGRILGPAAWPAIVDVARWELCRAVLTDPARRSSPGNKPNRLLSGIAVCGRCAGAMRSGGNRAGQQMYRCRSQNHLRRRGDLVDDVVTRFVVGWLARDGVTFDVPDVAVPTHDLRARADEVRLRISQVEDALVGDPTDDLRDVSVDGLKRNLARLRGKLEDLERDEKLTVLPSALHGVTAENFPGLPLDRRRSIVDYLCKVTVLPTSKGGHAGEESIDVIPHPDRFPAAVAA